MSKTPTAKEFLLENADRFQRTSPDEWMIEFAKLHVEAALKMAFEDAPCGSSSDIVTCEELHEAIMNSYPLENIK